MYQLQNLIACPIKFFSPHQSLNTGGDMLEELFQMAVADQHLVSSQVRKMCWDCTKCVMKFGNGAKGHGEDVGLLLCSSRKRRRILDLVKISPGPGVTSDRSTVYHPSCEKKEARKRSDDDERGAHLVVVSFKCTN
jgi:hypothetical protein